MPDKLRMGIIGAGRIAQRHLKACAENADGVEAVAIADIDEAVARKSAEAFGVADVVTDYRAILDRDDVEAVSICVPTALHPVVAKQAFAAGKHVLCEKPAGLDVASFREAMAAAEAAGKVFAMGFMERQTDNFHRLREVVQTGRLGRPLLLRTSSFTSLAHRMPAFVDATKNGGPFIDMFCHSLDTWSCALGARVASVCAGGFKLCEGSEVAANLAKPAYDTGQAVLTFDSGDVATVAACWCVPNAPALKTLNATPDAIVGPKGFLTGSVRQAMRLATSEGEEELPGTDIDVAHVRQMASFRAAVREGKPPTAPAEAGLEQLRISLAILKSMEENRVVALDEI